MCRECVALARASSALVACITIAHRVHHPMQATLKPGSKPEAVLLCDTCKEWVLQMRGLKGSRCKSVLRFLHACGLRLSFEWLAKHRRLHPDKHAGVGRVSELRVRIRKFFI
eukprot:3135580-Amphidinium_carterae.1